MGASSCCQKSQSDTFSVTQDSTLELPLLFRYNNENLFYGYPHYKELTQRLADILTKPKRKWLLFEDSMVLNRHLIYQYRKLLNLYSDNLQQIVRNELQASSLVSNQSIKLTNDFNTSLEPCLILEIQDCLILRHQEFIDKQLHIKINFASMNYTLQSISEKTHLQGRVTTIDSIHILKINQSHEQYIDLQQSFFTVQLYFSNDKTESSYGNQVTFKLSEFVDQHVHEKILRIIGNKDLLGKVSIRFQLVHDLGEFIRNWLEELDQREVQIKIILEKMEQIKQEKRQETISDSGEELIRASDSSSYNKRFDSLLSYDDRSLRHESRISVYDLPYKIH